MNGKNMRNLGIVGSIIGAALLMFGLNRYNHAKSLYEAASWFGENNSSKIWNARLNNYKIFIIVGAIIFTIFIILTIAGVINSISKNNVPKEKTSNMISVSGKVEELKKMVDSGLITKEEFELKKKDIIDKM